MITRFSHHSGSFTSPCVATIGFFDGVHRGHRFLISHVVEEARTAGMRAMVITFDIHPRQVLHQDYQPELLTTLDDKLQRLSLAGVDDVVVLHFDEAMSRLSAFEFMDQILKRELHVAKLVMGYDNRFGHHRTDSFDDYVRYGREMGMEVLQARPFTLNGIQVSSSVVRAFIKEGEIALANACLGYTYTVSGRVVGGYREGRKMGFPTANLDTLSSQQLIPGGGVYATRVSLTQQGESLPAMTNIGTRPTFGSHQRTVETHILHFADDLYDQQLQLSFVRRIRSEQRFDNVTQLMNQLKEDERMIEQIFNNDTSI